MNGSPSRGGGDRRSRPAATFRHTQSGSRPQSKNNLQCLGTNYGRHCMSEVIWLTWRERWAERWAAGPGFVSLLFSVILPVITIGYEITAHGCASIFFDPIPTPLHLLLVSLVPLCNYLLRSALTHDKPYRRSLAFANGVAITVASVYSVFFLPLQRWQTRSDHALDRHPHSQAARGIGLFQRQRLQSEPAAARSTRRCGLGCILSETRKPAVSCPRSHRGQHRQTLDRRLRMVLGRRPRRDTGAVVGDYRCRNRAGARGTVGGAAHRRRVVSDVADRLRRCEQTSPRVRADEPPPKMALEDVDTATFASNMRAPGPTPGLSESDMHASQNLETNMNNAR